MSSKLNGESLPEPPPFNDDSGALPIQGEVTETKPRVDDGVAGYANEGFQKF